MNSIPSFMDWYPHHDIEKKWQERWERDGTNRADDFSSKPKAYVLVEFPYPSGDGLHVGHARSYAALDAVARKKRMEGMNVLYPMGWDAFGLPTENYAIKTGVHPRIATDKNITTFRRQMKSLGLSFDWSREFDTTDPTYYRWTQWIFLQLLKRGLAYQATMPINWCPKDKIGLANEEVIGGKCERCGTMVTRKMQKQWLLKITAYAERLLKDLDSVDFLNKIKTQQVNWIGKSEGAEIRFQMTSPIESGTKVQKVLLATNNPAKVKRVNMLLGRAAPGVQIVTPKDVGLDVNGVQEGSDLKANAEAKARAYLGKTDLPTLGIDSGLFLDGSMLDPAKVKRNALDGADGASLSSEEVGQKMFAYYQNLAKKHGGSVPGYFLDVFALVQPDGSATTSESRRDLLLTDTKKGELDYHFPIRCLYKVKATGKYAAEQTQEEEIEKDLAPYTKALLDLLCPTVAVFTTRPDTLFGATYLVVAPEHELVQKYKGQITNYKEVGTYLAKAAKKSDLDRTDLAKEKTGVELKGLKAINPANNEELPVWVADYVLSTYGTGAIMAVPAHDERDFEFAKKFRLPIREVITPPSPPFPGGAYTGEGVLINSGEFSGMESEKAIEEITDWLERRDVGKKAVQYKLRDWIFSRQHYWGEPIPVVHCDACKKKVESESHKLKFRVQEVWNRLVTGRKTLETRALNPEEPDRYFGNITNGAYLRCLNATTSDVAYFRVVNTWKFQSLKEFHSRKDLMEKSRPSGGQQTLEQLRAGYSYTPDYVEKIESNGLIAWKIERVIPGVVPIPENQLPVELPHVEKYHPTDTGESPLANVTEWVDTTCPECGGPAKRETDTMPNWAGSSWYFYRFCDPHNDQMFAGYKKLMYWMPVDLYNGGMEQTTLHLLYSRFWNKFLYDQGFVSVSEPYRHRHSHGIVLAEDGKKMSKSFGNVINPDDLIREYGADTLRVYELFMGPFEDAIPWSTRGIIGVHRFLQGVYNLFTDQERAPEPQPELSNRDLERWHHKTIKRVTEDLETFRFNTAVSALMEFTNVLKKIPRGSLDNESKKTLLILLFPMAPHLASELWERTFGGDISTETWPRYDESKLVQETIALVVQVNGKLRARVRCSATASEAEAREAAMKDENVKHFVTKEPKKIVYVPGRLMNFVV